MRIALPNIEPSRRCLLQMLAVTCQDSDRKKNEEGTVNLDGKTQINSWFSDFLHKANPRFLPHFKFSTEASQDSRVAEWWRMPCQSLIVKCSFTALLLASPTSSLIFRFLFLLLFQKQRLGGATKQRTFTVSPSSLHGSGSLARNSPLTSFFLAGFHQHYSFFLLNSRISC